MDEPVLDGFGFPKPSPAMRRLVTTALRLHARVRRMLPARPHPQLRTEMKHRSYPDGYRIEDLGSEPCFAISSECYPNQPKSAE